MTKSCGTDIARKVARLGSERSLKDSLRAGGLRASLDKQQAGRMLRDLSVKLKYKNLCRYFRLVLGTFSELNNLTVKSKAFLLQGNLKVSLISAVAVSFLNLSLRPRFPLVYKNEYCFFLCWVRAL